MQIIFYKVITYELIKYFGYAHDNSLILFAL